MSRFIGNYIALCALGMFCVIAAYSYSRMQPYPKPLMVMAWATPEAAAIADLWNISHADIAKPVILWEEK